MWLKGLLLLLAHITWAITMQHTKHLSGSQLTAIFIPLILEFIKKNTKNWYTIDALGAIFAIFTILDTFTILLQYFYNTFTKILQY